MFFSIAFATQMINLEICFFSFYSVVKSLYLHFSGFFISIYMVSIFIWLKGIFWHFFYVYLYLVILFSSNFSQGLTPAKSYLLINLFNCHHISYFIFIICIIFHSGLGTTVYRFYAFKPDWNFQYVGFLHLNNVFFYWSVKIFHGPCKWWREIHTGQFEVLPIETILWS